MKCYRDEEDPRLLVFTELPASIAGRSAPSALEVRLTYTGTTGTGSAHVLDGCIIPAIVAAINAEAPGDVRRGGRYYNVGYRVVSAQDRGTVSEGVLCFRARDEADARKRAARLALDDEKFDARIDPCVAIDYVEEAEQPEQAETRFAIFEIDANEATGTVLWFCSEACRAAFREQNRKAWPFRADADGTGNDYIDGTRCSQCEAPLDGEESSREG